MSHRVEREYEYSCDILLLLMRFISRGNTRNMRFELFRASKCFLFSISSHLKSCFLYQYEKQSDKINTQKVVGKMARSKPFLPATSNRERGVLIGPLFQSPSVEASTVESVSLIEKHKEGVDAESATTDRQPRQMPEVSC